MTFDANDEREAAFSEIQQLVDKAAKEDALQSPECLWDVGGSDFKNVPVGRFKFGTSYVNVGVGQQAPFRLQHAASQSDENPRG